MNKWIPAVLLLLLAACTALPSGKFNELENGPYAGNQLREYVAKQGVSTEHLYSLDSAGYQRTLPLVRKGIPQAELFDVHGRPLLWWNPSKSLPKRLNTFLKKYPTVPAADEKNKRDLNDLLRSLRSPEGRMVTPSQTDDTDVHLFLYFSLNSGVRGDEMLQICQEVLDNYPKSRLQVYLVNMDKQRWWTNPPKAGAKPLPVTKEY